MKRTKPKWNKPGSPQRIRADVSKLVPTNSWGRPQYYHDACMKCRDCKTEFVFTALEQKAWYEEFGIPHYVSRVRCQHCSKKHKALERLKREYDDACAAAKQKDSGFKELLLAGMLTVKMAQESGKVLQLERCIGWLRKCLRLKPAAREPLYFLGYCYELAGNIPRAKEYYADFIKKTDEVKKGSQWQWRGHAKKWLEACGTNGTAGSESI